MVNLDLSYNELPALPDLPEDLKTLNLSNNELTELPILPPTLNSLDITGNTGIKKVEEEQLPTTLQEFKTDLIKADNGNYYDSLDNIEENNSEENSDENNSEEESKSEEEKDETPKTGIASYVAIAVGVAVISTIAVVYLRKRNA